MFVANYIDRVNVGFVEKYLKADLGLDAAAYGLGAGLFFVGYAVFEVPSNLLLERVGARIWLARITVSWGIVAASMAFVGSATQFHWLRFALGAAEAGFFPGVIYYFTRWLPAAERGKAVAIFLSGSAIASVLSGPLSGALLKLSWFGFNGWRTMLLVEGLFSVVVGVFAWFWLDSVPRDARWLSDGEKDALETTLAAEQHARGEPRRGKSGAVALLRDPQIALFCGVYLAIQLTLYAATFWLPKIIRKMGDLSDLQVGFLNSIPWTVAILGMYLAAIASARHRMPQAWVSAARVVAGVGMFLSTTGGPIFAFVAICFASLGFKSAASLFWPIPQAYLDARVAAPLLALVNSVGNLGGFVAPTVFGWLEKRTGSVAGGLYGLTATSFLAAGLVLFARAKPRPIV